MPKGSTVLPMGAAGARRGTAGVPSGDAGVHMGAAGRPRGDAGILKVSNRPKIPLNQFISSVAVAQWGSERRDLHS